MCGKCKHGNKNEHGHMVFHRCVLKDYELTEIIDTYFKVYDEIDQCDKFESTINTGVTCWYLNERCSHCGSPLATDGGKVWCISNCDKGE